MTTTKQSRGLIRSRNRQSVRDDKSPQVVRKTLPMHEPTVCMRCGAVYLRRTWRHNHSLTDEQIDRSQWGICPACAQVSRQEGQGRLVVRGVAAERFDDLRRRLKNVGERAMKTQPERRIVSVEVTEDHALEVLTTSQKLAHRLAHEIKKLLRGKVSYSWNDDGTLFATWVSAKAANRNTRQ